MLDARTQLDRQYYEMRWRILSLAADFDRIERLEGSSALMSSDARLENLRRCVEELLTTEAGRAERVQAILSDKTPVT